MRLFVYRVHSHAEQDYAPAMRTLSALALLLALTACGGGDEPETGVGVTAPAASNETSEPTSEATTPDPPTTSSAPSPGADPVKAAEAWSAAYDDNDGAAACALQTREYAEADLASAVEQDIVKPGTSCEDAVVAGAALLRAFGVDTGDYQVELVSRDGDKAVVSIAYSGTDPSEFEMVLADGDWLVSKDLTN